MIRVPAADTRESVGAPPIPPSTARRPLLTSVDAESGPIMITTFLASRHPAAYLPSMSRYSGRRVFGLLIALG
jgi:hypothetical protein